jgi:hydrogenase/urease accessory protein HupE
MVRALIALLALLAAGPAAAHPVPFSFLDLRYESGQLEGTLTVHLTDIAHELEVADPETLVTGATSEQVRAAERLLAGRIALRGGRPLALEWTGVTLVDNNEAWRFAFRVPAASGGALRLETDLFPYDPNHQTFVNVYEGSSLRQQYILSPGSGEQTYYRGTAAGAFEVLKVFVPSGAWHILIGPDHLLFLLGLLLLGGSWWAVVRIVTAFTIGHSVTLSLAVLGVFNPPGYLVEPAIALSIVVIGVDNLLQAKGKGRDLRAWVAGAFGLVHGFGFAGVLAEFGLPREALGWSLAGFNIGVEFGQLAFVIPAVALLHLVRKRKPQWTRKIVTIGSLVVIAAGSYWFVERVFG